MRSLSNTNQGSKKEIPDTPCGEPGDFWEPIAIPWNGNRQGSSLLEGEPTVTEGRCKDQTDDTHQLDQDVQ